MREHSNINLDSSRGIGNGSLCPHDDPEREQHLAVGKSSVNLLHPPLPLVGVSMWTERGCQQSDDSLANG